MVKKSNKNIHEDRKINALIRGFIGGIAGFVFFTAAAGLLPTISLITFYISIAIGLIFIVASIWFNMNQANLYARFAYFLAMTFYFMIIAYRGFAALFPGYSLYVGLLIVATVAFSQSIPIWNPEITRQIRNELVAPKSKLGRNIFILSIALLPIVGIIIYFIIDSSGIESENIGISIVISLIFWLIALILPFSFSIPNSPWEKYSENKS